MAVMEKEQRQAILASSRRVKPSPHLAQAEVYEDLAAEDLSIDKLVLDGMRVRITEARGKRKAKYRDIKVRVDESVIDGEVTRTIDGASTLWIDIWDDGNVLLNSGIFDHDEYGDLDPVDVRLSKLWFRLVKVTKTGSKLRLTFEDREVAFLRRHNRPRSVSRADRTRAQFVHLLVHEVKKQRIRFYCPERDQRQPIARYVEEKSRRRPRARRGRNTGISRSANLPVKGIRATFEQIRNMETVLLRAEAKNAGPKATKALVLACIVESLFRNLRGGHADSRGILQVRDQTARGMGINNRSIEQCVDAFLTRGFWGKGSAKAIARSSGNRSAGWVAQQTQGSAHPGRYDLYSNEADAIIKAFKGRRSAAGTSRDSSVSRTRVKQYRFSRGQRGKREDSWTAIQRLAQEVNWRAFMRAGVLWFISEPQLLRQRAITWITEGESRPVGGGEVDRIDFDWDSGKPIQTVTVHANAARWGAPPGSIVEIREMGPVDGRWIVATTRRNLFKSDMTITLKLATPPKKEPAAERVSVRDRSERAGAVAGAINRVGGAKGIVEDAVRVAQDAGGSGVYVASAYRPGDPLDHGSNDADKAARDIAVRGIDALRGPPSPKLDRAVVAIGKQFGRNYGNGRRVIIDTFRWKGYRVQIIWRTPLYGDHRGHIHIGVKKV